MEKEPQTGTIVSWIARNIRPNLNLLNARNLSMQKTVIGLINNPCNEIRNRLWLSLALIALVDDHVHAGYHDQIRQCKKS